MARTTVKLLEALVKDLTKRVEALEHLKRRRVGFEYEGSVGGDMVEQREESSDIGDRRVRG